MNRKQMRRWQKVKAPMQPRRTTGEAVSCVGKIAWWSLEKAKDHAKELNNQRIGDRPIRAYQCRISGAHRQPTWHVGRMKIFKSEKAPER